MFIHATCTLHTECTMTLAFRENHDQPPLEGVMVV